uniref:Uncharacterized protein n=1 Tax=Octopus bimaculoides TaxID=37653 RepID=A0A0L8FTR5_OCTBM
MESICSVFQLQKFAEKYFKDFEDYGDFCIELDNRDIDKDRAKFLVKRHFFENEKYKYYLLDVDAHLEAFGLVEAKKLAVRYFKDCEGYGDLCRELKIDVILRERALYLAEKYCGYTQKYRDFELEINKYTKDVRSQDVM